MRPKPWSHSALTSFINCPRQHHEVKVLRRVPDTKGEAAVWGDRVHVAFEHYLQDNIPLDAELVQYQPYLDAILQVKGDMHIELEMALDTSLNPCAMTAPNCFVRGIVDVLHIEKMPTGDTDEDIQKRNERLLSGGLRAYAMDHKTGKRKPDSKQMKLMALLVFATFHQVGTVKVGFFWLKTHERDIDSFTRDDIPALWAEFLPDVRQYHDAFVNNVWQPRQSGLCHGWCPVTSCEFWKPKSIRGKR